MNEEAEESGRLRSTVSRTMRLTPEIMARLQAVCDHLGVTVGGYLTLEVGKSVARDELALLAKQSQEAAFKNAQILLEKTLNDD